MSKTRVRDVIWPQLDEVLSRYNLSTEDSDKITLLKRAIMYMMQDDDVEALEKKKSQKIANIVQAMDDFCYEYHTITGKPVPFRVISQRFLRRCKVVDMDLIGFLRMHADKFETTLKFDGSGYTVSSIRWAEEKFGS